MGPIFTLPILRTRTREMLQGIQNSFINMQATRRLQPVSQVIAKLHYSTSGQLEPSKVTLYYTPTSCGAASFISAYIGKVPLRCEQVNIKTHKTNSGEDYYAINPKGNVPALKIPDYGDKLLNENVAVLTQISNLAAENTIAAKEGAEYYEMLNNLSYIASEVHPSIGALFRPNLDPAVSSFYKGKAAEKLSYIEKNLLQDSTKYLVNNKLTPADIYLYITLTWTSYVGISLDAYPKTASYFKHIAELEGVREAKKRMSKNPSVVFEV